MFNWTILFHLHTVPAHLNHCSLLSSFSYFPGGRRGCGFDDILVLSLPRRFLLHSCCAPWSLMRVRVTMVPVLSIQTCVLCTTWQTNPSTSGFQGQSQDQVPPIKTSPSLFPFSLTRKVPLHFCYFLRGIWNEIIERGTVRKTSGTLQVLKLACLAINVLSPRSGSTRWWQVVNLKSDSSF